MEKYPIGTILAWKYQTDKFAIVVDKQNRHYVVKQMMQDNNKIDKLYEFQLDYSFVVV